MCPIVTLTTDFGNADYFVGAMKGVILSINPRANIVDITHAVPPQDVRTGAIVLANGSDITNLTLIVVGVLLWLINTFIPMDGTIKRILNIVVVIAVVLWLLYGFGVLSGSGNVRMPTVR